MKAQTRVIAPSLEAIMGYSVDAWLRRFRQLPDVIIGLVGERGSGKSLSGAMIALRGYAFHGEPIFSNMDIKMTVSISDEQAQAFGLEGGGEIKYEAQHLDRMDFLSLSDEYGGGCLFFDEFNLEFGEARRSASNINLITDRAIQQLRKMKSALIYTVINEMYVDNRIRDNTDIFIRCYDTAFKPKNICAGMEQGVTFEWYLYPMTARFAGHGNTYNETHRAIGPIPLNLKPYWGVIDTYEKQARGQIRYTQPVLSGVPLSGDEGSGTGSARSDRWAWLDKKIDDFYAHHAGEGDTIEILSDDMRREFGVEENLWPTVVKKLRAKPRCRGMEKVGRDPTRFKIPNRALVSSLSL